AVIGRADDVSNSIKGKRIESIIKMLRVAVEDV
ncbi:unnamed protein product, partial [marine sediment metagenome]